MNKKLFVGLVIGFLLFGVNRTQAGLADGLILYYSFDVDHGNSVVDDSGNNHIGCVMGAAYTPAGRLRGAYSFDGVNDYILAGNLGFHKIGTISFWMNAAQIENWRNPFSTDYAGWDDNIRFEESANGQFSGGGHGLGRGDVFMRAMEPNRWYHVVYIWDESYVYGYLDGELKFKNPHPDPSSKVHPDLPLTAGQYKQNTLNFSNVAIGNGYSTDPQRYWKGLIDEVRIYDRPLSASEVKLLYQGRADGLVLHYTFDRNSGNTVLDESGFANNAVVQGASFTSLGRIGGAYQFDGIDDQITVKMNPSLELGDELTLAAWFYATDNDQKPIIEWSSNSNSGVHLWTNVTGFQWHGLGTGVNLVDTKGNEFDHVISTSNPAINQWHHLAVSYSKTTGKAQLYLDGIPTVEKTLGAFTPQTNFPLYIGRRPTSGGKSFKGMLDDVRIYNKALKPADVRAMYDALTHGKIFQNFEANNGSGSEYGWPINAQYGVTAQLSSEKKHSGSYSWKLSAPYGPGQWSVTTGIKSQVENWHLNAEVERHDRLTFWILANPASNLAQAVRVKFFDHNKYVWDPTKSKDGFIAQTQQQAPVGAWTQMSILFTQLPTDFNFKDIDKIEICFSGSGTYYIDDIEITSADRIYQTFEKRAGVSNPSAGDYGWAWNGNVALSTDKPAQGKYSWNLTATNTLGNFAGASAKYEGKDFGDEGYASDIWHMNLIPASFNPPLYGQLTLFFKQRGANRLANNFEVAVFDHGSFTYGQRVWPVERSSYDEWAKVTVPLADFPANFNFSDVDKIEMQAYWPGAYYFDDIRVAKYPQLRIDEGFLPSGLVTWPEHPGAVKYVLQRATSGAQGPWSSVYSGAKNLYQTSSLSPCWFRVHWESDADIARGTVAYISDWSQAARYELPLVLIEKDKLQQKYVEWTFIPQAGLYEIQQGSTQFGPWTLIYQGSYKVPPSVPAIVGKWYRARAIQKSSSGAVSAYGPWSPALVCDPAAFVTADGVALRQKKSSGKFLKLSGVNLGNYLLIEPWMFFGGNDQFTQTFPDDWTIRNTLLSRSEIRASGLSQILNQYRRAYIKESDLDNLARMGINFIRLPFYADDVRPVNDSGQWLGAQFDFSALDRVVKLCGDRGIYVLLDLHGAYGCQSKESHSGRRDYNRLFTPGNDAFRQRTVELWKAIALHYKSNTTVLGYDLINEPYGAISPEYYSDPLKGYNALWSLYDRIYKAIRNSISLNGAGDTNHLIVIEGIPADRDWETVPNPKAYGWANVMYQFHYYGLAFGEKGEINGVKTYEEHQIYLNDKIKNSRQAVYKVPVLIGEFNGFSEARIWELLMNTFNAQGWSWGMWSYKIHDTASEWGIYTNTYYDEKPPDFQNDSFDVLMRKMSKYATTQYHQAHNALINIIRAKAVIPGYVHDLKAAKSNRTITLSWSAPYSTNAITQYRVRYGTVSSGQFAQLYYGNATPGVTISGLVNGVDYQFRVEAVSSDGVGPCSNTVIARPGI